MVLIKVGFVEGLLTWIVRRVPRTAPAEWFLTSWNGAAAVSVGFGSRHLTSRVPSQETTLAVSKHEYHWVTPSSVVVIQDELNVINEIPGRLFPRVTLL